jgi:hypothetical protein
VVGGGLFAAAFVAGNLVRVDQIPSVRLLSAKVLAAGGPRFPSADTLVVADTLKARCGSVVGAPKTVCYESQLLALRAQRGTRFAMGALNRLSRIDRDVLFYGHEYSHMIGITAFKVSHDVSGSFKSCTEILQSGCYHGVIQTYLLSVPHVGAAEVNGVCHEWAAADADQWLRFQCMHGMGHGLTMIYDHDLPRALAGCDLLHEEWDRKSCYGGTFMENIVFAEDPSMANMVMGDEHQGLGAPMKMDDHSAMPAKYVAVDKKDPFHPCSKLGERYQEDCWLMQSAVILFLRDNDFARTFAVCDSAPARWRYACYTGTGTEVSGQTLRDPDASVRLCSRGSPRYQPWCYEGVVKNYIDVTAKYRDGLAFCKIVPGRGNRLKCYQSVGEEIAVLHNTMADRPPLCGEIAGDPAGTDACLFGAQVNKKPALGTPIVE